MIKIPLLPHTEHVLPSGRVKLTIAQAHHVRMVKEALSSNEGFVMAMVDSNRKDREITEVPALTTRVQIIDFHRLAGELLGITVEGVDILRVMKINVDYDHLLLADCKPYFIWHSIPVNSTNQSLADKLQQLHSSIPDVGEHYPTPCYNDITWVCQRWLEVLPIDVKYKQLLIHQESPKLAVRFLMKLLQDKNLIY
ncbi:Lon protease [Photobacterium leiognathi subsp. mandapamensis]|nr:Lon protease [Photobacterium leiognathi subsp. mandapamensis]